MPEGPKHHTSKYEAVMEILGGRIRKNGTECRRRTTEREDGLHIWDVSISLLRQLVEKTLEMQCNMAPGFVEIEKAYDTERDGGGNADGRECHKQMLAWWKLCTQSSGWIWHVGWVSC